MHGIMVDCFSKWLARNRRMVGVSRAATMKTEFSSMFLSNDEKRCGVTASAVAANVRKLPEVWRWIRDHNGDRAPPHLRSVE